MATENAPSEVEIIETSKMMLEILDEYDDDPQGREQVKQELMNEFGIDPDKQLAVGQEESSTESDEDKNQTEIKFEGDEETKTKTEESTEADPLKELQEANRQKDLRIAELEGKLSVDHADSEIRDVADAKVRQARDELEADRRSSEAQLKEFRDNFGDEAAIALQKEKESAFQLREQAIRKDWQNEYEMEKAQRTETVTSQNQTMADIAAVPELRKWYEEAREAENGVAGKSSEHFRMAHAIDDHLQKQAEWKDVPQAQRFAEAVRRVKLATGQATGETESKESTRQRIAEEIRKKQSQVSDAPNSLSDLNVGGEVGDALNLEKLEKLTPAQLCSMNIPIDKMDDYLERISTQ